VKRLLIGSFILVVCLPFVATVFWISRLVDQRLAEVLTNRAQAGLLTAERAWSGLHDEVTLKARIIAQLRDVRVAATEPDGAIELISRLHELSRDLHLPEVAAQVHLYDASGAVLAREPSAAPVGLPDDLIAQALGGSIVRLLHRETTGDRRVAMVALVPLYREAHPLPAGVVAVVAPVGDRLADALARLTDTEIVLMIESENSRALGSTIRVAGERWFPVVTSGADVSSAPISLTIGSRRLVLGRRFLPIDAGARLGLLTAVDAGIMDDLVRTVRASIVAIGASGVLLAFVLAIVGSGRLLRPVATLMTAAERFGEGDLEHDVRVETGDELQVLGEAFRSMRDRLRGMLEQLQATNTALDRQVFDLSVRNLINQALINRSEESLLPELMRIIVQMMEVGRGTLWLHDPQEHHLILKAMLDRPPLDALAHTGAGETKGPGGVPATVPADRGILGRVVGEGRSLIVSDPPPDLDFLLPPAGGAGVPPATSESRQVLLVPLRGEERILGVMAVAGRAGGFREEDRPLLEDVADQAAIALQKTHLYELAITDGLTRLFIHRYFQRRLEEEIVRAQRSGERISLLLFDIDHFKKFNDTYGHQLGDRVIRLVAETVRANVRVGVDIPARYGGEEFAIVMPDTPLEGARVFAERLRGAIERAAVAHEGQQLKVTVSLGCATWPDHADRREALIKAADTALYEAKRAGRNRVAVAESIAPA
jgi:diguanylate cyclase (GGDEF)-like protein